MSSRSVTVGVRWSSTTKTRRPLGKIRVEYAGETRRRRGTGRGGLRAVDVRAAGKAGGEQKNVQRQMEGAGAAGG